MNNATEFFYELAKEIKTKGYRCFLYDHDHYSWMSIITPKGSWLTIFHGMFGGYDIVYQYVPSREFGRGCRYNEDALWEITSETMESAEAYGKAFGMKQKGNKGFPKHYENGYVALMESYNGAEYVEI